MDTTMFGHQGDILVEHLNAEPDLTGWTEIVDPAAMIIAEGETTGHRHRVSGKRVRFFRSPDGISCVALLDHGGALIHDDISGGPGDHNPHALATGWTRFERQREATLDEAGYRTTAD